jgi:hypothetical protein
MQIACTEVFKKDFLKLPGQVRKAASKQIAQLLIDHTHPSLHLEGIVTLTAAPAPSSDNDYCTRGRNGNFPRSHPW